MKKEKMVMVDDIVSTVLEDFEKESADLWYMVDPDDFQSMTEVDCSARCDMLEHYLRDLNFNPMAVMDDPDDGIYVILSVHNPTTLCSVDVVTGDEHWYKIFGDLRDRTNYNYIYKGDRDNLYRAFADMCIWMEAARNNENEYRVNHLINLSYKKVI